MKHLYRRWNVFHRKNSVGISRSIIKNSNSNVDWNHSPHKRHLRWVENVWFRTIHFFNTQKLQSFILQCTYFIDTILALGGITNLFQNGHQTDRSLWVTVNRKEWGLPSKISTPFPLLHHHFWLYLEGRNVERLGFYWEHE